MQLHCRGLAVWQHARRPQQSAAGGVLQQRQHARPPLHSSRCLCTAAADGGDVVRPSAQAAAPVSPLLADLGAAANSSSEGSASGSQAGSTHGRSAQPSRPASSSSNSKGSYSEFYKAVNSVQLSPAAANGSNSSHGGSSSAPGPRQPPQHASSDAGAAGNETPSEQQLAQQQLQQATQDVAAQSAANPVDVQDAIRKAQQALAAAEDSLSSIHKLRSAQPPGKWAAALRVARSLATVAAAGACLVASHAFGLGWQWAGATIGALALAALAFQQQNVTESGAVAAAAACLATFGCSLRFGLVLLAVSYSICNLRQFKEGRVVQDFSSVPTLAAARQQQEQQRPRDWLEVAGFAVIPTILAIAYGAMAGCLDLPLGSLPNVNVETWRADLLTLLQGAVLGWYACICGDAWSSELGELSGDQPRLITTLQPVRKGTHGAVTLLGLSGAAAGGLLAGAVFYCAAVLSPTLWVFEAQRAAAMAQWRVIPLGLMAGLFGSLLDSLLGAVLQFTGYDTETASITSNPGPSVQRISGLKLPWLTDNIINVVAASVTAALTAVAALATFG